MACACAGGSHSPVDENPPGGTQHDPTYDLDALGVPQFVNTNYIDLAGLTRISMFRSHDGHDYSDGTETCRSMKHYFKVPTSSTIVYAPVSGIVRTIYEEWAGTQVQIRSNAQPAFTFIIFHISLASPLSVGATVTEGSILGTHIGIRTWSDIAVEVNTPSGRRLVSYFETLTESAFAPFLARGLASPASLIITRAQRDAYPLTCSGEMFTNAESDPYQADVAF
jgi:hypothetical protein